MLFPRFSLLRTNRHRAELEAFTFSTLPQRDLKMQTWGPSCCSASGLEALWAHPHFRPLLCASFGSLSSQEPGAPPPPYRPPYLPQRHFPSQMQPHPGHRAQCPGAPCPNTTRVEPLPTLHPRPSKKISKQGSKILGRTTHCVCMPRPGAHPRLRAPPHLPPPT